MHDKMVGGHWVWDDASAKASFDYMASIFGSNGRVTLDQWMASFGPYMEKVQPYVEGIELTEEQVKEWINVTRAAYNARKWSDASLNPAQVKVAGNKINLKVAEIVA